MASERATPDAFDWPQLAPHHLPRYLLAAEYAPGKVVLDAGCGSGYGAALLQAPSMGRAARVVAVDIDPATIRRAEAAYPAVEFLVDDCHTLEKAGAPGTFDLICSFENIEHLAHPGQFLAAAARLLAPEGVLLVSTPDRAATPPFRDGKPDNPFHVMEWHQHEFAELLGGFFGRVEMRVQVESHAHVARSAAMQSLRQGLFWNNPLMALLWRKLARRDGRRSWRVLESLIAPSLADYPIVEASLASIWGKPASHVAICRLPRGK